MAGQRCGGPLPSRDVHARLALLAAEVEALRAERRSRRRLRRHLIAGLVVALLAAAPLVALAADVFGDVPGGAQFHDDVEAIALAGITTGCSGGTPPNFCPDDPVTRKAMAAFMHRGFGRVHQVDSGDVPVTGSGLALTFGLPGSTQVVKPGLPPNLLSGAAGFILAEAIVTVSTGVTTHGAACPCRFTGALQDESFARFDGSGAQPGLPLPSSTTGAFKLIGVLKVTSSTAPVVRVRVDRTLGTIGWTVRALLVTTYFPFGGGGTNIL